jgi:hypothetical protein
VENLHPTAGVRILLELDGENAGGAEYRAAIYTPTDCLGYRLAIALPDGAVTFKEPPQDAAAAYADLVHAMARSLVRDAFASSPPAWPRRLLRWRDK